MKIQDLTGKKVQACCSFDYLGYTVSASTICQPSSILVFDGDKAIYDASSIEDAVQWLNVNN